MLVGWIKHRHIELNTRKITDVLTPVILKLDILLNGMSLYFSMNKNRYQLALFVLYWYAVFLHNLQTRGKFNQILCHIVVQSTAFVVTLYMIGISCQIFEPN